MNDIEKQTPERLLLHMTHAGVLLCTFPNHEDNKDVGAYVRADLFDTQAAIIERLRGWLKSIEWVHMQGNGLHCGMCGRAKTLGHDPQCNWVEDAALLGERDE